MRVSTLLSAVFAAALAHAQVRTAKVYIQAVHPSGLPPTPLADVQFDVADPSTATVTDYEAPELPEDAALVRVGLYDPKAGAWLSSTSAASVANFAKGYSPTILLSVDGKGEVVGAAYRGVRIDAGQTRDFGPQAVVSVAGKGKQPELNKPVVLSPEGKKVVEEEKSLLQKYSPLDVLGCCGSMLTLAQVLVADRRLCVYRPYRRWWWRGQIIELLSFVPIPLLT
jgi:hypothetical protein